MGEENRSSSGGGTVMIVVAILGGILLLGCCGGLVVLGAGLFYVGSEVKDAQMQFDKIDGEIRREGEIVPEIQGSEDPLKVMPEEPPASTEPGGDTPDVVPPPESNDTPATAREENKE